MSKEAATIEVARERPVNGKRFIVRQAGTLRFWPFETVEEATAFARGLDAGIELSARTEAKDG